MNTTLPTAPPSTKSREIGIVKQVVAQEFGVAVEEIEGPSRREPLPMIRHVAMSLAYKLVNCSLPDVAEAFGRGSHGIVMHAIEATRARCDIAPTFKARVERVTKAATLQVDASRRKGSK